MKSKVIITCEHASNRCPAQWGARINSRTLNSHRGFDPGARELARLLAQAHEWSLHEGQVSRLLIDLNRSLSHPHVYSPWSLKLDDRKRQELRKAYYDPYRATISAEIKSLINKGYHVVHLSIHSFTPVFRGQRRLTQIGLLFDPLRTREKALCTKLQRQLRGVTNAVHFNRPYRGTDDGLVQTLRGRFKPALYSGIEIEINQRIWREKGLPGLRPICQALATLAK